MTDHNHHLIENGTMLLCDASGCPTQGRPFLLAGGDELEGGDSLRSATERIASLEAKVKKLQKQMDELRRILAYKGFPVMPE